MANEMNNTTATINETAQEEATMNESINNATVNENATATAENKEETMNNESVNNATESAEEAQARATAELLELAYPEIGTTNVTFTAKGIDAAFKSGKMTSDNAIQRSDVWKPAQRDLFVHSVITGFPIPQFISIRSETTNEKGKVVLYDDLLDGKQRTTTIRMFRRDEHKLGDLRPVIVDGTAYDISGKKYSELPEEVRDKFDSRTFSFVRIDGADDETEAEIFSRMNNGTPMSAIEKTRCKAADLKTIKEISEHDLFTSICTANAMRRYAPEDMIAKAMLMLGTPKKDICLDNKVVRPFMETLVFADDEREELENIFDYILEVYRYMTEDGVKTAKGKAAKKMVVRTHLISTIPMVAAAITQEIAVEDYAEWIYTFFGGKVDQRYTANASSGSNHHAQVEARWNILEMSFNKFFKGYTPKKKAEEAEDAPQVEDAPQTADTPNTGNEEPQAAAPEDEDDDITDADIAELNAAIAAGLNQ